jgi:hypothetical protein
MTIPPLWRSTEDQTMSVLSSDDEEEEIGVGINAIQVVDLTLEDDE